MHEILSTAKQALRKPVKQSLIQNRLRVPRQLDHLIFNSTLLQHRVIQGPRLFNSKLLYYLAFRNQRKSNVNSVGRQRILVGASPARRRNKMRSWWQILSTPTADTPGTLLLLHYDSRRYLVGNIGEGAQRLCLQRKIGLNKMGDIFLTGTIGWQGVGGLLGMILTAADAQTSSMQQKNDLISQKGGEFAAREHWLNLHGGQNLTHMIGTARRFVFRKGLPIYTQEFRPKTNELVSPMKPTWSDPNVQVWALVTEPEILPTRKRSHDEVFENERNGSASRKQESQAYNEDQNDQVRRAVVSHMFGSEWRLDALVEKKLSEVQLPATIFFRTAEGKIDRYKGPLPDENPATSDINVLVRSPWPGAKVENLPPTAPSTSTVSYIFKNHEQRGTFLPKKAQELGVKPGRDFGMLTGGTSVTTANGNVVHPSQVMGPSKPGGGIAVIDLPEISFVRPLLARKEWTMPELMKGLEVMIWILGPGVVEDAGLQNFMRDRTEFKHIVSSQDCCPNHLALESPAAAAIRLNLLDPERFPIPAHKITATNPDSHDRPYEAARVGQTVQLEPRFFMQDETVVPYLDTTNVIETASQEVNKLADIARNEVESAEYQANLDERQRDIPCKDAEVICLGTGSALPSKYRNVSGTLVRAPEYGNYLFDCGENSLGQMKRVFGDALPRELRNLKVIWISHLHADHHLGTVSVIKAWHEQTSQEESTKTTKLVVASDEGMLRFLKEYSEVEDFGYQRIQPMIMGRQGSKTLREFDPTQTANLGLSSIQVCPVDHCRGALAVVFNFPNGFKIAYSGDCRPCPSFAEIGKDATLLIHEATFDDELQGDAEAKKHSTTSEALGIAKDMNARRILLTHFSQRYQKIPVMNESNTDQIAIVAFDYMRVKIADFAKLEAYRPALLKLYEESENAATDGKVDLKSLPAKILRTARVHGCTDLPVQ